MVSHSIKSRPTNFPSLFFNCLNLSLFASLSYAFYTSFSKDVAFASTLSIGLAFLNKLESNKSKSKEESANASAIYFANSFALFIKISTSFAFPLAKLRAIASKALLDI